MPLPIRGVQQANLPYDGVEPFVRSRAVEHWRACDGVIQPLTRQSATLGVRTAGTTVYDHNGRTLLLPASMPAWSAEDWDGDLTREEMLLRLSDEEQIELADVDGSALYWPVRPLVKFHEWIYDDEGPLWSFTNDATTGAYLLLEADGGVVRWVHHNATTAVESVVGSGLVAGDRCSVRALFYDDGHVHAHLALNGTAEVPGTASAAHTPAAAWGGGSGTKARINGFGDSLAGAQILRTSAVYFWLATQRELQGVL